MNAMAHNNSCVRSPSLLSSRQHPASSGASYVELVLEFWLKYGPTSWGHLPRSNCNKEDGMTDPGMQAPTAWECNDVFA